MNVMLLAAGEGTRLRPYTLVRPKPAIPFLNVPLASYPLAFLDGMKVDRLIVNTFHLPTKIVDLFINMNHGARRLHFSHEINQIMGSGGGLSMAHDYFRNQGDLILMNADEVILPLEKHVLAKAFEQHQKNKAFCTLLTMEHPDVGTKYGGIWLDHKDQVCGFGKSAPTMDSKKAEHFIGVQILSEKIFDYLPVGHPSNILYDGVTRAILAGQVVQRYKVDCHWYETGNPKDFLSATGDALKILADTQNGSYPNEFLQRLLERFSKEPPVLEKAGDLTVLKTASSIVAPDCSLSGFAVLGSHSRIEEKSILKNIVVAENITLARDTSAENEIFLENN
ncbi:MAG: NTP transferase domain-containing protein [Bdellovibrionaceae bacterium]|nr:NTP transferase domain-containing protein [Pseudobdellovibrionaceae bacterium]